MIENCWRLDPEGFALAIQKEFASGDHAAVQAMVKSLWDLDSDIRAEFMDFKVFESYLKSTLGVTARIAKSQIMKG
jgi:hypothetical protein